MRGRGASENIPNRFEKIAVSLDPESVVDPSSESSDSGSKRPVRTQFLKDHSRTILSTNDSPDIGFNASVNPYRGCEHGCAYCYARPTHEYLGFSAGLDFESKIVVKENAAALLREKLMSKSWRPQAVAFSGVTDCYQPIERKLRLTRSCLEVLAEFRNPFLIITKNHLITRDIDLIADMARDQAAAVFITITSLNPELTAILEPRTARPALRLDAVRKLSEAGIPVGVLMAPIIPAINDEEIPQVLAAARDAGAITAGFTPLRLPGAVLPIFTDWLARHYPDRRDKVLNRIRSIREGQLNDPNFGSRMRGSGPFAEQIRSIFKVHARRLGLDRGFSPLSTAQFRRPGEQMRLL
ncbi:MAG: PA0069 family radical SAM protein [Bacteriovoracia bacterium]